MFWMNQNSQIKFEIKNSKQNVKNIKFGFLIHFYMEIRLNGLDRSYLV
jgi:hypothetical protein